MQLTINTAQAMRAALAAASCGLLGMATVATAETAPDTERKWQVDSVSPSGLH